MNDLFRISLVTRIRYFHASEDPSPPPSPAPASPSPSFFSASPSLLLLLGGYYSEEAFSVFAAPPPAPAFASAVEAAIALRVA